MNFVLNITSNRLVEIIVLKDKVSISNGTEDKPIHFDKEYGLNIKLNGFSVQFCEMPWPYRYKELFLKIEGPGSLYYNRLTPDRRIEIQNNVELIENEYSVFDSLNLICMINNKPGKFYSTGKYYIRSGKILTEDELMIKGIIE